MSSNLTRTEQDESLKLRVRILILVVVCVLALLVGRLVHMQIFKGAYYEGLARNNRIRIVSVKAPRGKIVDTRGIVLADNRPAYNLIVLPEDVADITGVAHRLAAILDQEPAEIEKPIREGLRRPYNPVLVKKDITFDQMARIESELYDLPGVAIDATTERDYVYKDLAAHVLGFLGEISRKELKHHSGGHYATGDLIGKSGVELSSEDQMRGIKGTRVFEVDAVGRKIKVVDEIPPVPGNEVRLTLDMRLQNIARTALGDRAGSVVVINPQNGRLLALVSSPRFDPNMFLTPMAPEMWKQIIEDPLHPLENRATRGQYPPGSIFKIPVTLAGLDSGQLAPEDKFLCGGQYSLGTQKFNCWKRSGHGEISLVNAIAESCDVYFYRLGEMLGIDTISAYAQRMGFGHSTGLEIGDEAGGLIPTREWKQRRFGRPWLGGETINTSIGQGYVLVTPLQVAKGMSAAVNGGRLYTPRILADSPPHLERDLDMSDQASQTIREALRKVVEGDWGTGRRIRDPMFSIGGKTGTAQVTGHFSSKLPDEADIPYKFRDHAWFFGFSPVDSPELLVAVVVEHGGHGGSIAAPIARDVIKGYYFLKGTSDD